MWWEFKVILTCVLALLVSCVLRSNNSVHEIDKQLGKAQWTIAAVVLAVILWFIWGPTHYELKASDSGNISIEKK